DRIKQIGFNRVMEEVAYTWFNRFTALRFMEVNDYLPMGVRVLSSTNPESADPDMMNEALTIDLEIDKEYVYELKINNKTEELFKYLIIKLCNDLNRYLPFMFETIDDYTEILFPEGLLAKDSLIREMTDTEVIPEDNWTKVEVIGWLYQYYIAEEKDRVIKAKKKYKTEEVPFATQLFTPDWIVRYMVQNSLGRYWVESHPEHRDLINNWEFYLENPNRESDFEEKLAPFINKELKVEDIKCFDPAMGSGHILVYMFDVLYEIYSKCGYMEREIPRLIIENNLYGLDIDDRAYQLACFSVVMKALEYNNRFFRSIEREGLTINLVSVQESNIFDNEDIAYIVGEEGDHYFQKMKEFIRQFENAKTFGSLIKVKEYDVKFLEKRLDYIKQNPGKDLFEYGVRNKVLMLFETLLKQAKLMHETYDILVTNPPYMGNRYMNESMSEFMKIHYTENKADTFAAFIEYCIGKVKDNGHLGFLSPFVWMFISTYQKLREYIVNYKNISSLIELEYNAFPEAMVPVCCFTLRNYNSGTSGQYIKLSDFPGSENQPIKTLEAIKQPNIGYRYSAISNDFTLINESPIAYWANQKVREIFNKESPLNQVGNAKAGLQTGDNDKFLRMWSEVSFEKIGFNIENRELAEQSSLKWFPCNKGGSFRKWYGNNYHVVNWKNDGAEIRSFFDENGKLKSRPQNLDYYFKEGLTWSTLTSSALSVRYSPKGFIFETKGSMYFPNNSDDFFYILGYLNSKVVNHLIKMISPTLDYHEGPLGRLPIIFKDVNSIKFLVVENIEIMKYEWDSFEISWDFKKHPLLTFLDDSKLISSAFKNWNNHMENLYNQLKKNEEEINRIIITNFGLQSYISPLVNEEEITLTKADKEREVRSLISFAIGCIFGRYSLDNEKLVYAGGEFSPNEYKKINIDRDNVLPILSGTYFEDDIVVKFIDFISVAFGEETLIKNLEFIAETLGKKKGETAKETLRRYFLNDFYSHHLSVYSTRGRKAPIYWLFTSGKLKAFNCLIYMHRYDKTTLSRIRTDYLHEYQIRLDAEKKELWGIIDGDYSAKEISNAKKELKTLDKKIEELKEYDELLHHMADMQIEIDLDDGVTVNYDKFKGLVAKI
ncbi:BREX-1 system adenine-specific DNA-methyltransferase PglX, partial [Neobacillus vireti]|uniref:BREX-1 system adenine-specific DNA-methyltransferase PglX n=1 Tax=Neobacillus vireti TaxID=220686 RepID=UPI003000920B